MPHAFSPLASSNASALTAGRGYRRPSREYFQKLLEYLELSGHYKNQVEAFYWAQRRQVRLLKAVRADLTVSQLQQELRAFNADLAADSWQCKLLRSLLVDTTLVEDALSDIEQRSLEAGREAC